VDIVSPFPEDALANINTIVGQGTAARYVDEVGWLGRIISLDLGNGYWVNANTSFCFSYRLWRVNIIFIIRYYFKGG